MQGPRPLLGHAALGAAITGMLAAGAADARDPTWPAIDSPHDTDASRPGDVAVVIGNERYDDLPDVPYAAADARLVADLLVATVGLPSSRVHTLYDVSEEQILAALARGAAALEPGGRIWIYYAGHGRVDPDSGSLLLVGDTVKADWSNLASASVSMAELLAVEALPTDRVVFLADACYDGAPRVGAWPGAARSVVPDHALRDDFLVGFGEGGGVALTAASRGEQAVPLHKVGHGAFTYFLAGALRGWADGSGGGAADDRVTLGETAHYVSRALEMVGLTQQNPILAGTAGRDQVLAQGRLEEGPDLSGLKVLGTEEAELARLRAVAREAEEHRARLADHEAKIAGARQGVEDRARREWRLVQEIAHSGAASALDEVARFVDRWTDHVELVGEERVLLEPSVLAEARRLLREGLPDEAPAATPAQPGPSGEWAGQDLRGRDFRDTSLAYQDLSGADLRGANLIGADLQGADLLGANLTGALVHQDTRWPSGFSVPTGVLQLGEGAQLAGVDLAGTADRPLDLRDLSLAGVDLSGADLRHVDLTGADLTNARLERTALRDSELSGADLRAAFAPEIQLERVALEGADLRGARLDRAHLDRVSLERANLRGCFLGLATLSSSTVTGAVYDAATRWPGGSTPPRGAYELRPQADLRGADLAGQDLSGARLQEARLQGADLSGADLTDADLRGALLGGADLSRAILRGTRVEGADFSLADLRWADLDGNFYQASVVGALLTQAVGEGGIVLVPRARLERAVLAHRDLREVDLSRGDLEGADLRETDLRHANLEEAQLRYADLRGADLRGANLVNANLWRANLRGAKLTGADLSHARLRRTGAGCRELDGVRFTSRTEFPVYLEPLAWLLDLTGDDFRCSG